MALRALIYLKGGIAWQSDMLSVGNIVNVNGMSFLANASGSGTQRHRLRHSLVQCPGVNGAGTPLAGVIGFPVSITEREHIVKAGVNYRFW
jgi:hypothetical protein